MYDGSVNHWFEYQGERLQMFYHMYNLTHLNERCVEVAIAHAWLAKLDPLEVDKGLEVGNVLGHYDCRRHVVIDLYEQPAWYQELASQPVVSFDILTCEYMTSSPWAISLSTIEHTASPSGAINIIHKLAPCGLISFPTGVDPALDAWLEDGAPGSDYKVCTIVREQNDHGGWVQTRLPQVRSYGPWANAIAVLEWRVVKVVILLPWRTDNGWREKLWNHCRMIWEREFPDWQICIGISDEGPFQRSQAINRAAAAAGDWDVALIIDGDTISDPQAVRAAVDHALETGALAIAHRSRLMLTKRATEQILAGRHVAVAKRQNVSRTWQDSVSCAVAVSRTTWDLVNGFDERFIGWGFEDTAFYLACETLTGKPGHFEQSECLHLWHASQPEASRSAPTYIRNQALKREYEHAHWDPPRMRAVLAGVPPLPGPPTVIPRILHRTVPKETSPQVEEWWEMFSAMHPTWDLRTYREPIDPALFPLTSDLWDKCGSGAQKAGLIRLEALYTHGGVYVDSDVEPVRPLDPLLQLQAFAGWEDANVVPDAVLGATPEHSAFRVMLSKARISIESGGDAWASGPGVTTSTLPGRNDVLLLPPGSFYPVHYKEKTRIGTRNDLPWVFLEHKWHHSWGAKAVPYLPETAPEVPADIAICIPWRDSGEIRRRDAYKWCINWWASHGFQTVVGSGQSRAEMCNHAAQQAIAAGFKILVFADADTWAPASQIIEAAALARDNRLVHAFEVYARQDSSTTSQGLRTAHAQARPDRYALRGKKTTKHISGLSAISVELWNRVGGFDERFDKWGFEDQAFHLACEVLGDSPPTRVPGTAIHWAHRADPNKAVSPSIEAICLMRDYCSAAARIPEYGRTGKLGRSGSIIINSNTPSPEEMREVLAEEGGPLSVRSAVS